MHPVVVTTERPWEVFEPLEAVGADFTAIQVDPAHAIPTRFVKTFQRVRAALTSGEGDSVLIDTYDVPGFAAWSAAKTVGVPVAVRLVGDKIGDVVDDNIATKREAGEYGPLCQFMLSKRLNSIVVRDADAAIVVSSELEDRFTGRGVFDPADVAVVPIAFRPTEFAVSDGGTRFDTKNDLLLTTTNLAFRSKFDGVCQLLPAVESVLSNRPDAEWIIAGGGQYEPQLRRRVDHRVSSAVREQITLAGYVDDIGQLYAAADLFAYVSPVDGYPNVVLEAQGCGLPVVANDGLGMRDQITHEESGLLVDPTDEAELTAALGQLLDDPAERARLGANAKARVERENSKTRIGHQLLDGLDAVLDSGSSSPAR